MTLWFRLDGVGVNGVDDLIRALDRDRIDRTFEMEVLRMGPLLAIDIHPIERKPSARQGFSPAAPDVIRSGKVVADEIPC